MAAAHGFEDEEDILLDLVVQIFERIVSSVELPLPLDFEDDQVHSLRVTQAYASKTVQARFPAVV